MSYVTAKRLIQEVNDHLTPLGFPPLVVDDRIIPSDDSTNFICSGMQVVKDRFRSKDGGRYSSIQSCIRTKDLDLVGDGHHLTYFEMVGCFGFGNGGYGDVCRCWDDVMRSLSIPITHVTCHPSRKDHASLWRGLGRHVVEDLGCEWSDGVIGGQCCEMYVGGLEVGNLVNPLGDCVDVGFGLERLVQVMEGKDKVDETSLFDQSLPSLQRDHVRCLMSMLRAGVKPGSKGRENICRRLARRMIGFISQGHELYPWVSREKELLDGKSAMVKRLWPRHKDKPESFWWETYGVSKDDLEAIL